MNVLVAEVFLSAWRRLQAFTRPLSHAGIPANSTRTEERDLMTANVVVILAIATALLDSVHFYSFAQVATTYVAIALWIAVSVFSIGFALLGFGHRRLGVFLFSNAVLALLATTTLILGTRCGIQFYFVAFGIGAMFVWPGAEKRMRIPQATLGLALLVLVMTMAGSEPIAGPPLPREVVDSVLMHQTVGTYLFVCGLAFYSVSATERAEAALSKEYRQSESLLLNILPHAIADRLKVTNASIADSFDEVSILFADVVGFTPLSDRLPPVELVEFLNRLFSQFDSLAEKHGLEKIKTIGDAYMVASGIPTPRTDHAIAIASMAIEMQETVSAIHAPGGERVYLRIGIDSGPAIAGVIGIKKFTYDLWGDTVNTASRMESHGVPGAIQVSSRTQRILQEAFEFESRGLVDVKGKGLMDLYILKGRRKVTSV